MNKIIVVSYGDDSHKDQFIKVARKNGFEPILFDAGGYPNGMDEVSIIYTGHWPKPHLLIEGREIDIGEITGVWWRRPRGAKSVEPSAMGQYIRLEGEVVARSLPALIPHVNWISDPEATRMACRKPVQLGVAKQAGLKIPQTYIGNSPEGVKKFIDRLGKKKMIMKPVGTSFVDMSKDDNGIPSKVIFTKIVDPELVLENIDMVKNCPVIFQEAVQKEFDLRITVVDEDVFCAKITLEGCPDPRNIDWRNHSGTRIYQRHDLPNYIAAQCAKFTHAMGLRFGCIDMAYSIEEGYTFFEINPQGQWLPSEIQLGYPISTSLLKSLTRELLLHG